MADHGSNTRACFTEFIGQEVIGVLFGGLQGYDNTTKTLVFEDGRGLTINGNGSYWITSASSVASAVRQRERELRATKRELRGVLDLAGVHLA